LEVGGLHAFWLDILQVKGTAAMIGIVILVVALWAGAAVALVGHATEVSRRSAKDGRIRECKKQEVREW
jgi:hypothetical protein